MPSITRHSASGVAATVRLAAVGVEAAAGPGRVGRQRVAGGARHGRRGPAGARRRRVADALQRQPHGPVEADQALRRVGHVAGDVVLAADHLVPQRLDERPREAARHRRDQADPQAGQAGREHRYGEDDAPGQPGDGGVARIISSYVRTSGPPMSKVRLTSAGSAGAADEVAQHVADGDRLDPDAHPAGRDHHRQALGQVAQHLERGRAGSDDHGGPQHRGRHAGGQQDARRPRARERRCGERSCSGTPGGFSPPR